MRAFAELLRSSGISVILDQFFLESNPGGPPEGWAKWSSDGASNTRRVLIIGSESWFQCFDNKQKPGTGLGAACEAGDIRQRIFRSAGINEDIRVVLFDDADAAHISLNLDRYHRFNATHDFDEIVKWLSSADATVTPPLGPVKAFTATKPSQDLSRPRHEPSEEGLSKSIKLGVRVGFIGGCLGGTMIALRYALKFPPGSGEVRVLGTYGVVCMILIFAPFLAVTWAISIQTGMWWFRRLGSTRRRWRFLFNDFGGTTVCGSVAMAVVGACAALAFHTAGDGLPTVPPELIASGIFIAAMCIVTGTIYDEFKGSMSQIAYALVFLGISLSIFGVLGLVLLSNKFCFPCFFSVPGISMPLLGGMILGVSFNFAFGGPIGLAILLYRLSFKGNAAGIAS